MNKDNLKKALSLKGGNEIDQFFEILELPDEQFDTVYPMLKEKFTEAFSQNQVRKAVLEQLEMTPVADLEAELKGIDDAIEEIKNVDDISENKKDFVISLINESSKLLRDLVKNPREKIKVKIQKIHEDAVIPTYAHTSDAGADVCAVEEVTLKPHETKIIPTGIKVSIPLGYEIQVRPRSGLSAKTNLRVANAPGTIDAGYLGEVGVIITNTGNLSYTINKGDKIAQLIIMPVPMIEWQEVDDLGTSERGENGYGSTDQG